MYQVGATINELTGRFRVNRTTVMRHLDRAGVETRYRRLTLEQIEEAARLYAEGWSLARLGERLGVSRGTVLNAFRKAGVKTRPRPGERGSEP
jgi:transposase-like protein